MRSHLTMLISRHRRTRLAPYAILLQQTTVVMQSKDTAQSRSAMSLLVASVLKQQSMWERVLQLRTTKNHIWKYEFTTGPQEVVIDNLGHMPDKGSWDDGTTSMLARHTVVGKNSLASSTSFPPGHPHQYMHSMLGISSTGLLEVTYRSQLMRNQLMGLVVA